MNVIVNNKNITSLIMESTYNINSLDVYQSWLDGNFVEHRIVSRKKVAGSFTVALYGQEMGTVKEFLDNWNKAVKNNVVTIHVYVSNLGEMKKIEAHYSMNVESHRKLNNGKYIDLINITLEER